jgi:hypothetical protein
VHHDLSQIVLLAMEAQWGGNRIRLCGPRR